MRNNRTQIPMKIRSSDSALLVHVLETALRPWLECPEIRARITLEQLPAVCGNRQTAAIAGHLSSINNLLRQSVHSPSHQLTQVWCGQAPVRLGSYAIAMSSETESTNPRMPERPGPIWGCRKPAA